MILFFGKPFNLEPHLCKFAYRNHIRESPAELITMPEIQLLYQPMALFPIQMLPYQYYQIIRGKFIMPSAYFLYNFFMSEYPFPEAQYAEPQFKEKLFEEKGEYTQ